jgi:hypothetical protein
MRPIYRNTCQECKDERHRVCSKSKTMTNLSSYVESEALTETLSCCDGELVWTHTRRLQLA